MPFVEIAGLVVQAALNRQRMQTVEIGDRGRAFAGTLRSSVRDYKREWPLVTRPILRHEADTLIAVIQRKKNLLRSPHLDTDTDANGVVDDWQKDGSLKTEAVYSLDAVEGAQKIAVVDASAAGYANIVPNLLEWYPAAEGETAVLSAAAKVAAVSNAEGYLIIHWLDSGGGIIGGPSVSFTQTTLDRVSLVTPAPAATAAMRPLLSLRVLGAGGDGEVWFKDVQLERAPAATAFDDNALPMPCAGGLLGGAVDCHARLEHVDYRKYADGERAIVSFTLMEA